ncbi:MAG: hypothetical protein WCQ95_11280 [Bacteroidota bacterium]
MRYIRFCILFVVFGLAFFSCKKETELPVDMGYKYFPVNTGHWAIYNVDSISYNDFTGAIDSFHFQIKEFVESVFVDNSGAETQRLECYYRPNDTSNWVIRDVWAENLTASTAQRVEENLRLVKLVFPVTEGLQWNGNAYNMLGEQNYEYDNVHSTFAINGFSFDSTLVVKQKELYTLISEDLQKEIYAARVGLVYKRYVKLSKQPSGVITKGIDYSYTLHSFGN